MSNKQTLRILYLCTLLFCNLYCKDLVEFFDDRIDGWGQAQSYSSLIYDDSCANISMPAFYDTWTTKRVETKVCLMVYEDNDCRQSGWSLKVLPPGASFDKEPKSYKRCNGKEGGSQLNVDIVKYRSHNYEIQEVLESYRHVCSCVTIPEYVLDMVEWSIRNNGNELLAYFEPDCLQDKWRPSLIKAGNNLDARQISVHRRPGGYKVMSFGPNSKAAYFNSSCKSIDRIVAKPNGDLQANRLFEELLEDKLKPLNEFIEKQKLENIYVLEKLRNLEGINQQLEINNTQLNTAKDAKPVYGQLSRLMRLKVTPTKIHQVVV